MPDDPLQTPVQFVKGVGPNRAKLLEKIGLHLVRDVLWNVPREIQDLTDIRRVGELVPDRVQTVCGEVVDIEVKDLANGKSITAVLLHCQGDFLRGTWFNQPWMREKIAMGQSAAMSGKPRFRFGRWEMPNPKIKSVNPEDLQSQLEIECIYGLTEGLKLSEMQQLTQQIVSQYSGFVVDPLPEVFCEAHRLPRLSEAIRMLHTPQTRDEFQNARRRIVFDDLLEFQLALAVRRKSWTSLEVAPELSVTQKIDSRIRRLIPYPLTTGQNQAIAEICADLASSRAMHRLLQAEVGAGKTVVALYALLVAVANECQSVLMAPTEVLANQHWNTIDSMLSRSRKNRVGRLLLTGNLSPKKREAALEAMASGEVQLIIGTQAVIQKDVRFHRLGLVVIDEQHRFGVMQRAHFSTEGIVMTESDEEKLRQAKLFGDSPSREPASMTPHVLVMTATPIPRSLCLTQFGDLDISFIRDLPPGRQKITTHRVQGQAMETRMWQFVREQLIKGRQVYVICPRVEESVDPGNEKTGAERFCQELRLGELKGSRVGLVHGQMDRQLKWNEMEKFRNGEYQVLVATTVVEVGVDVPNATVMVIRDAESYGLSQLHQLRGRISRGKFQGYCFLMSGTESTEANQRLAALESISDGFRIAEVDYQLRGPGDVIGTRQHGQAALQFADLSKDLPILEQARRAAFQLVESGKYQLDMFQRLRQKVEDRFGDWMNLPKTG